MGENWINANVFSAKMANSWNDAYIHISGVAEYVSGSGARLSKALSGGVLYVVMSKNPFHIVAGTGPLLTASTGDFYWSADSPIYHRPVSGSTDRISVINDSSTAVEVWITPAESLR